jgi:hypothetical protein
MTAITRFTKLTLLGAVLVAGAIVAAGCASVTASAHLERGIDFSAYRTYDWGPPDNLPVGDPRLDNNSMFKDHLMGAVEKRMAAKGYARADAAPDLLLHYHANVAQRVDVYQTDSQYGYNYSTGVAYESRMVEFEQGTIVLDIVDAKTNRVVWRGWSQGTMNGVIDRQDLLEKRVDEGVMKMMQLLPAAGVAVR